MATRRLAPNRRLIPLGALVTLAFVYGCTGAVPAELPTDPSRSSPEQESGASSSVERSVPTGASELAADQVDTLFRSSVSGVMSPARSVLRSSEAWVEAWAEISAPLVPAASTPALDFSTHQVLVLAMGARPSGGHTIELRSLSEANDTLYAVVRESTPGSRCVTTQSLTQPVLVLGLPLVGDAVRFIEEQVILDCL